MLDVLIVSLGSTGGLRSADEQLLASLQRAGVNAGIAPAAPQSPTRTLMLTDLRWAAAARRTTRAELAHVQARALIYSTTTAALLWPAPGAIRFDSPAAANRLGRHGLWQRPLERRRLLQAPLLLPQSEGALLELPATVQRSLESDSALVLPVPVEPSGDFKGVGGEPARDIAAITYAANPAKKGLDLLLDAWLQARRDGEELLIAGVPEAQLDRLGYTLPAGVRVVGMLSRGEYRALLRRARVFVCAARREDYGIAQLEALADGCMLVTVPSPGPYVALPLARELDQRLVGGDLGKAMRTALDDPSPHYQDRATAALEPYSPAAVDRLVSERLLPRLLS